jgi:hypothetical protein
MPRAPRRAERLLGACLLAALCGCAVQEPRHATSAPAEAHPPASVTTPAVAAETAAPPGQEKAPGSPPQAAPDALAAPTLELLRDAEQFTGLPHDAQQQTLALAELRHNMEQTPLTLVHYALLLSLSEPDRQSSAGAAAHLRDMLDAAPGAVDRDLEALARLLMHALDEREHLLAQNVELQRKLNQLKAIEQQLGDRDGADAPQPAP